MKILKIGLVISIFTLTFFLLINSALAASDTIYFFYNPACPHCTKEEEFLKKWMENDPSLDVKAFNIYQDNNHNLLNLIGDKLGIEINGTPFTLIGEYYQIGYLNDETTGRLFENYVNLCRKEECPDIIQSILSEYTLDSPKNKQLPEIINLPLFGEIKLKNISLPLITVLIAAIDGFNPCAMWALLFLISLLIGIQNRWRRLTLGITFLAVSGISYFIFMAAWLNLLLFIGLIIWVRLLIGLTALGSGGFNIRRWWKNRKGICEITEGKKQQKIFTKLKNIISRKSFIFATLGIIILAFAVNLIELICSAGLPAVYTQILSLSHLSYWQYYLYLLLYIFIFMFDDILVFVVAIITLEATGLSTKYSRYSNLIGGILMIIIGLLLIFKPAWLVFG